MLKLYSFRPALKYMISTQVPKLLCKKKKNYYYYYYYYYFLRSVRMSGKNINVGDKKIKKEIFTKTKKHLRQMSQILIKYQFEKKNYMV